MIDPVVWNEWHVVAIDEDMPPGGRFDTRLLGEQITIQRDALGGLSGQGPDDQPLKVFSAYAFIWTSLGTPAKPLFSIDEFHEPDRKNVVTGSVAVRTSAPRVIENFLDMGHFPFVHTGWLGEEPHTEVKEYNVVIDEELDEVRATECKFYQPKAAAASDGGIETQYIYRVPHPYCSVLYKSCPFDANRMDVIAMFVQPLGQERVIAHTLMSIVDDETGVTGIRHFQLTIFGQDKPILENQLPKRLPLDPRAETPIRADKSSIFYRRWLRSRNIRYGVVPHTS